jgi:hypothetical protein
MASLLPLILHLLRELFEFGIAAARHKIKISTHEQADRYPRRFRHLRPSWHIHKTQRLGDAPDARTRLPEARRTISSNQIAPRFRQESGTDVHCPGQAKAPESQASHHRCARKIDRCQLPQRTTEQVWILGRLARRTKMID